MQHIGYTINYIYYVYYTIQLKNIRKAIALVVKLMCIVITQLVTTGYWSPGLDIYNTNNNLQSCFKCFWQKTK